MKKIKYILSSVVLTALLFGCDAEKASQDAEDMGSLDRYPTPTFTLTSSANLSSLKEVDENVIVWDVVLDKPIDRPIDFSWVVLGGSATEHEDYDLVNATVPAFGTTAQLMIMIYNDTVVEEMESLELTIESGPSLANKYLINPDTQFPSVSLSIQNWSFCSWILETSDTYGDGWNGGYVEVTSEGETTQYAEDNNEPTTFEIAITDGADYSFTYVSGGGTGAGPGWESENYFKLTAPDGTVWEEGTMDYSGIPTPGLITSGTNNCP